MFHAILPSKIKFHDSRTDCEEENEPLHGRIIDIEEGKIA
jgi:hypothetical protein